MKYRGYDDFQAAHTRAKWAACYELGEHWKRVAGASVRARLPAAWTACKVGVVPGVNGKTGAKALRVARSPRDVSLPAACFWPDEMLPVGPEYYLDEYALDDGSTPLAPRNENDNFVWWNEQETLPEAAD